jgi:ABC-type nitrate/sulfonate/bicarbonate transport system substrate-binding protein
MQQTQLGSEELVPKEQLMRNISAASIIIACLLSAAPAHAQQGAPEDATLALPGTAMTFVPAYVAEDMGLFAKQGLRVKSVVITGIGSINAVISGSADFGSVSGLSLTRAAAHGQRLLAIANTLTRPTVMLVVRKDLVPDFDPKAPLEKRVQVLRGHTIAVDSINSIIHAYVLLLGARAGINLNEIRIAPMAPTAALSAFNTHQVDGFAMSMPWPLQLVLDGTATIIANGASGDPPDMVPFAHNVIVAKPETCEKRKSVCMKMGHAMAEAATIIRTRTADVLAVLKKRFPTFDDKLLAAGFEQIQKGTPEVPTPTLAALENSELFNVGAKLMKPEEKLKSYDGLFTDAYVR